MPCNGTTPYMADELEPKLCDENAWMLIVEAVFLALVILLSITANSFVLFLVARHKSLQYLSMMVSVCGVVVDLMMTGVFHIPAMVSVVNKGWKFSYQGCQIIGGISYYIIIVRWMIMAVIALDRIAYIMFPLTYHRWSKPYVILLGVCAWVVPMIMIVPAMVQVGVFTYRTGISTCALDCSGFKLCQAVHMVIFGTMFIVGVIVPTCLYIVIAIIAKNKRRRIRMGQHTSDEYLPTGRRGTITRGSIFSADVHRLTRADARGILVLGMIFACFITTNTPQFLMVVLRRIVPVFYTTIPLWGHMLIANLFYLSNVINPILILLNKDFRTVLYNKYCKRKPRAYRSSSLSNIRRASITPSVVLRD